MFNRNFLGVLGGIIVQACFNLDCHHERKINGIHFYPSCLPPLPVVTAIGGRLQAKTWMDFTLQVFLVWMESVLTLPIAHAGTWIGIFKICLQYVFVCLHSVLVCRHCFLLSSWYQCLLSASASIHFHFCLLSARVLWWSSRRWSKFCWSE